MATTRAATFALLASGAAVSAQAPPDMIDVQAYDDVIAAEMCLHHGYPWMVRIGPRDVLCLASRVGVAKRAVRAQDVIDAAVRQVRGR